MPDNNSSADPAMPDDLRDSLLGMGGVTDREESDESVLGASIPHRTDRPPEEDVSNDSNHLLSSLGGNFPINPTDDPRLEKIAKHNMARIMGNLTVSVTEFEASVYTLTDPVSLKHYNEDMLKALSDKTIVLTEEPIQYLIHPTTGHMRVVVVVKKMKMIPEVKGIDRAPLTDVSSMPAQ